MVAYASLLTMNRILPLLQQGAEHTPFVIQFLNVLRYDDRTLFRVTKEKVLQDMAPLILQSFDLIRWSRDAFRDYNGNIVDTKPADSYASVVHVAPIQGYELDHIH